MTTKIDIQFGLPESNPMIKDSRDATEQGRSVRLFDMLADRISQGPQSFLYIVPTRSMANKFEREMLYRGVDCLASDCYTTLNDLATKLFCDLHPSINVVDDTRRTLIIEKIVAESEPNEDINYNPDSQGFVRAIADDIKILKQSLENIESLRISPNKGVRNKKTQTLAKFVDLYDKHLHETDLVDAEDVMKLIAETPTDELMAGQLGSTERLVMHGFFDFSPSQTAFVKKLCECARESLILLDYQPDRARIFGPAERTIEALRQSGANISPRPIESTPHNFPTALIAAEIFTSPLANRERIENSEDITIIRAASRAGEVEAVASQIKRVALLNETALRRICVTFPKAERYAELIREIFPRYGIQFNFSYGFPLKEAPIIIAIFRMLEVARDFHRERVCELFYSPYILWKNSRGEDMAPAEFIDQVSRDARIIEGRENWLDRLMRLAEAKYREESAGAPPGAVHEDNDHIDKKLDANAGRIKKLAYHLDECFKSLDALNAKRPLAEYCALLLSLIRDFGLRESITRNEPSALPPVELEKDFRALARFERALNSLADFEPLLPGEPRAKLSLDDFISLLRSITATERYQVGTHRDAGVQVMEFPETRGMEFDYLYVIGMTNRDYPSSTRPSIFLTRGEIEALKIPGREKREAEQRYHFLRLLCLPKKKLTFGCPISEGGEPTVMSPYLHEVAAFFKNDIQKGINEEDEAIFAKYKLFERAVALQSLSPEAAEEFSSLLAGYHPQLKDILVGLRIESERRANSELNPWSSSIENPSILKDIQKRLSPPHPFSITQLENFGRCPYRFFAMHLMNLQELIEPEEEISPLTRGGIVHQILSRFFLDRKARGKSSVQESEREEAHAELTKLAEEAFERVPFRDLFMRKEKERVVGEGGLIDAFLEIEIEYSNSVYKCAPRFFEFSFGGKARADGTDPDSNKPYLNLGDDIQITGIIDRIDISEDGKGVIIDYKTGRKTSFAGVKEIRKGISYQLPVYMLAIKCLLGLQPVAGEYYQVHDGVRCKRHISLADIHLSDGYYLAENAKNDTQLPSKKHDISLEALLDETAKRAIDAISRMREGNFPVTSLSTDDANCRNCDFKYICRHPDAPKGSY